MIRTYTYEYGARRPEDGDIHVTLTIDPERIADQLVRRARKSKSGRATAQKGAIKLKIDRRA